MSKQSCMRAAVHAYPHVLDFVGSAQANRDALSDEGEAAQLHEREHQPVLTQPEILLQWDVCGTSSADLTELANWDWVRLFW